MTQQSPTPATQAINLQQKLALIDEHWSPRVVAEMNDYQFKVVRIEGDFIWHSHADTDEAFFVLEGQLRIDFRDGHVLLQAGELYVVPRGVGVEDDTARDQVGDRVGRAHRLGVQQGFAHRQQADFRQLSCGALRLWIEGPDGFEDVAEQCYI